jgi:hypothetical protein
MRQCGWGGVNDVAIAPDFLQTSLFNFDIGDQDEKNLFTSNTRQAPAAGRRNSCCVFGAATAVIQRSQATWRNRWVATLQSSTHL